MSEEKTPAERGPNCYQCRHFAVSWDPSLPYSCRLMGFKSRALPAIEVLRVDGVFCKGYVAKEAPVPVATPIMNRPDPAGRYSREHLISKYC